MRGMKGESHRLTGASFARGVRSPGGLSAHAGSGAPVGMRGRAGMRPGRLTSAKAVRRRTVAIIEDEKEMRGAYSTYLRKLGYASVRTFATGESFERAVEEERTSPELLLVDYRLPGKDGIETAKDVTGQHPEVKVIVTTADDSVRSKAQLLGFHFLQKPFSLAALAQMMDRL